MNLEATRLQTERSAAAANPRRRRISSKKRGGGIGAKLGVYDDVFFCLSPGEPWLEHGIVEHRYKELCPAAYLEMIDRWGHVSQGPRRYSVTAFLTRAWSQLARDGMLATKLWSRHWPVSTQRLHPVLGVSPWPSGSSDQDVGRLRSGPLV